MPRCRKLETRAVRNKARDMPVLFPYWLEWRLQLEAGAGGYVMGVGSCYQLWIWDQRSSLRTAQGPSLSIKTRLLLPWLGFTAAAVLPLDGYEFRCLCKIFIRKSRDAGKRHLRQRLGFSSRACGHLRMFPFSCAHLCLWCWPFSFPLSSLA